VMWYSICVMRWRSPSPWISFVGFDSISIMLLPPALPVLKENFSDKNVLEIEFYNWEAETSKKIIKRSLVHMLIHLTTSTV
jgi:hypothetical protein